MESSLKLSIKSANVRQSFEFLLKDYRYFTLQYVKIDNRRMDIRIVVTLVKLLKQKSPIVRPVYHD